MYFLGCVLLLPEVLQMEPRIDNGKIQNYQDDSPQVRKHNKRQL